LISVFRTGGPILDLESKHAGNRLYSNPVTLHKRLVFFSELASFGQMSTD